jgi:DNA-binding NtrC family response regulator
MTSRAAILCVDDEVTILKSLEIELRSALSDSQYLCEFAESADEAFEIIEELRQEGIRIVLVVSDWLMPGMNGDDFLIRVHRHNPDISTILLTGQADEQAIRRTYEKANLVSCLHKPWKAADLKLLISSVLSQHDS